MTYPSKNDWWIGLLLGPSILMLFGGGILITWLMLTGAGGPPIGWLPALILPATGLMILWFWLGTSYEITPSDIRIRLGPIRKRVPLNEIIEVCPRTGFDVEMGWGFAWSLDRVFIKLRNKKGGASFFGVSISPADKVGFLRELADLIPDLEPTPQGSLRRAADML